MSQSPPDAHDPNSADPYYPPADQPPWDPQPSSAQAPGWQDWAAQAWGPRFDPADPLISDDYNGWFRRSTQLLKAGWRQLALVQLVVGLPAIAVLVPVRISYETQQRAVQAAQANDPANLSILLRLVVPFLTLTAGAVIAGAIYGFGNLACLRLAAVIATGGRPRLGDAFRTAVRRMPAMIGWYVLAGLIGVLAFAACFLPLIYVSAVFMILPTLILFERGNAIARSFRLFHADLSASVARVATIGGLAFVGSLIFGILTLVLTLAVLGSAAFDPTAAVAPGRIAAAATVTALLNGVYYFLAGILGAPLLLTAYADLRARHEPFTSASLAEPGQ